MDLQFIPFHSPEDKGWDEATEIYRTSFPYKEQRSESDHRRALSSSKFSADGVWSDHRLVGILYHWHGEGFDYIEHLAVAPALRGQRVGSEILAAFCRGRRVVLEIDPPVDAVSIRRLHFYEQAGFHRCPQMYLHPSFRRPFTTHQLVLMSYPTPLTDAEARAFADFVRTEVLAYSEHTAAQLPVIE